MRAMRRILVLGAVGLVAAFAAAPASATRTEVVRMYAFEPDLVNGGVVFRAPGNGGTRIMRAAPGVEPALLTTVEPGQSADDDDCCIGSNASELAGSGDYAAVSRFAFFSVKGLEAENSFYIRAGPATGPLTTLHQCRDDHPIDVDGTLIAYTNGCTEGGGVPPVVIRNLAVDGAPTVATLPQTTRVTDLDLAGQHVAMLRSSGGVSEIAVRDYAQPNDAYTLPGKDIPQFSLQADGKLAVKEQGQTICRVRWYSKAEPTAHNIDVCPFGDVRLAGDRIALEREVDSVSSLDLVSLNGQSQKVANFGAVGNVEGFDFDGTRLAYAVGGCVLQQNAIFIDDLAGEPSAAESTACPVTFRASKVRATSSGLVKIPIRCDSGCQGYMSLTRGGKLLAKDVKQVNLQPGSGNVYVRLTASARKLLRQRRELSVRASMQAGQRNGIPRDFKRTTRLLAPK